MLRCQQLQRRSELVRWLQERGADHWVSCLTQVDVATFREKLRTYRVEDELVSDVFTDCVYLETAAARDEADRVLAAVGLGLRRKKVRVQNQPGVLFAFVNMMGPSKLMRQKAHLSATAHKLSAEERVRRTTMQFTITSLKKVKAELARQPGSFWVTAWQKKGAEEAKKTAVTTSIDNALAIERFKRCLLVEVPNCQGATRKLTETFGLGLRSKATRARPEPGTVAVFLENSGCGAAEPSSPTAAARSPKAAATAASSPPPKRPRRYREPEQTGDREPEPEPTVDTEELYVAQVRVLEHRLLSLLPSLPREQLSTPFVQARIEEHMHRPHGCFDKFQCDICRIWRRYVDQ